MAESDALRARFADLRGGERRLRNPPPNGQGGAMLAEGFRLVRQAQDLGHHLEALLVRSDYRGPLPPGDYGVLVLDPPEVNRLTGFGDMREMAGLFPRPPSGPRPMWHAPPAACWCWRAWPTRATWAPSSAVPPP